MKYFSIPSERIGVAIGPGGSARREIERRTGTRISIDSETGEVTIEPAGGDPLGELKARDVLQAIARGFSPERAFRLFDENQHLEIIDIRDFAGGSEKALVRFKGRLIGEEGKTRRIIEEATGASVSIYGKTIALIGSPEQLEVAKEAAYMLLEGAPHPTVYRFLERKRREAKRQEARRRAGRV